MTWLRKHAFVFTAAVLFVAIAVNGLISLRELGTLLDRFRTSRDSDSIVEELNETLGALRDAETGLRGYLLTGRADYLEPYYTGRALVEQHVQQLQVLTATNPAERPLARRLRQTVDAKLNELAGAIERYRTGGRQAAELVMTNQSDLMSQIRRLSAQLTDEVKHTREIRRASATSNSKRAGAMIVLTSTIAALLILVTVVQMARATHAEQHARERAESANRLKDQFIATVSHELRTPLTAILGWSRILVDEQDPEVLREGLRTIESCASAQAKLIDDLLDMSRIMSGKMRLSMRTIDMGAVTRAGVESVRPAAEAKGVELKLHLDDPIRASADPDRLQQIVWNLVSNAVKFTPRGGRIDVRLSRTDSQAVISVHDNGEGIDADFLPHVFDPFRQADASKARVHKGLGLGLSIVRDLAHAHGGTVAVSSPGKGEGATFTVSLPVMPFTCREAANAAGSRREDDEWPIAMPDPDVLTDMTILVVDDHRPTLDLLTFALRSAGATVVAASSAEDGCNALLRSKPDLLISDIGMPGADGLSFITRVRRLPPGRGGCIPAIALTAYAREDDRERVLRSGFQAYLTKPIEPMTLVSTILDVAAVETGKNI